MKSPTAEDIRELLDKHKVSQGKAAKLALVSERTFKRYCAGSTSMHPFVWKEFKNRISEY